MAGGVLSNNERPTPFCDAALVRSCSTWKTDCGIGLGSKVEDVRKAYGKPSDEDKVEGTKYRWVINGDLMDGHYLKDRRPELGESVLVYRGGADDDFRASMFGIRNRKVVWIVLLKHA
jgi:hypothetical protein